MLSALSTTIVVAIALTRVHVPPERPPILPQDGVRLVQRYLRDGRLMEAMVVSRRLVRDQPDALRVRLVHVEVTRARHGDEAALRELDVLRAKWPDAREVVEMMDNINDPRVKRGATFRA